jgi:hypothetical protein
VQRSKEPGALRHRRHRDHRCTGAQKVRRRREVSECTGATYADVVAVYIKAAGKRKPTLLGAKDIIGPDFVKGRLIEKYRL